MGRLLTFVSLSTICGLGATLAGAQVTQSAQAPISITLSTSASPVKVGSDLNQHVAMSNTSDARVEFGLTPETFVVDVRDGEGKAVDRVKKARPVVAKDHVTMEQGITVMAQVQLMEPRATRQFDELLNKEFDLSKPGTYTVQATEWYRKTAVKSNIVTITVVP